MMLIFLGIISLIFLVNSAWTILKFRKTTYLITNLYVIIHQNFYKSSTKIINIKDIKTKELEKSFIDKFFQTGSIKIFTGETKKNDGKIEEVYDELNSVFDPEETLGLLNYSSFERSGNED